MSTDVLDVSRRSHSHRAGLHPPASKSPPSLRTFANIRRCDSLPTQSPQIRHPPSRVRARPRAHVGANFANFRALRELSP